MSERVFMVQAVENFIKQRIDAMEHRPTMWAWTRFEFVLQLVLLIEMWHFINEWAFSSGLAMRTIEGDAMARMTEFDEEWAKSACVSARGMITRRS